MEVLQKFWYAFYIYLGISVVMIIVCVKLKYTPQKLTKMHRIPSVIFAFTVFIWVTGFPLWLGIICSIGASAIYWLLLPNYVENISKAGEVAGKALFKKA